MKTDLLEIKKTVNNQREDLRNTYNVADIGIFGSVARGENNEASDIDVLVRFVKPVGMFTFIKLENHLSQLFGKKVDLVTQRALKPAMKDDVLAQTVYV